MAGTFLTCALAVVLMQHATKRLIRRRIGADQTHLLYDPGTGNIERYAWSAVLTDKFSLLIGRRAVLLVRPVGLRQATIFPADGLRAILSRLPPASFVGRGHLQWSAFRRGNLSLWTRVGFILAMAVLLLLKEWHPEWFRAARAVLRATIS
jgi:hypothetical protein